jgi:hypothetical protein
MIRKAIRGVWSTASKVAEKEIQIRLEAEIGNSSSACQDLDVFKLAHQLALKTYSTTKVFPREETDLKG